MVSLGHLAYKACLVMMGNLDIKVPKATGVCSGYKDYLVQQGLLEIKDQLVITVLMESLVSKVLEDHREWTEMLVPRDFWARLALEAHRVKKESVELWGREGLPDLLGPLAKAWVLIWPHCQL